MTNKRLSRSRRAPQTKRPAFRLEKRDIEIVRAVHDCRALTAEQIQTLFFPSMSATQRRLHKLFHHEYLNRQIITALDHQAVNTPMLYTIGKHGVQVLLETYGDEIEQVTRPIRQFSLLFADHLKRINDFRVAVVGGAVQQGVTLETWHDERYFKSATDYVTWEDSQGHEHSKPILPDGYFCLLLPTKRRTHCFLEVDRNYQPHHIYKQKIDLYEAYVASGQYQERFSKKSMRVLIVTSGERRLQHILKTTEKSGGDGKYWFTTFQQVTPDTLLTAPIWRVLGMKGLQPLLIETA